jgi:DNA replication protein DnaC
MTTTTTTNTQAVAPKTIPPLPADLEPALRRLKLAAIRRTAPEVLLTAKTQRWTPEEVLRTLIEAEITARDASNTANRLKAAAFPVIKTFEGFDVSASSIPQATIDYLASLEWIRAQHNLAIIGPPGTGKSHVLIRLGHAAVHAGHKVRYFTTAASILDRLLHHASVVITDGKSFRMRHAQHKRGDRP